MKYIKRTKYGLVEKRTGHPIVSPLEPRVRQNIDADNPDAVTVNNYDYRKLPFRSSLDPNNPDAICVTNPYGTTPRKVPEQDRSLTQEDQTEHLKRHGKSDKKVRHRRKKF
jgi:hypothetical protein